MHFKINMMYTVSSHSTHLSGNLEHFRSSNGHSMIVIALSLTPGTPDGRSQSTEPQTSATYNIILNGN